MFYSNSLKSFWLKSGFGIGKYKLESFDSALLDAGVGDYNLIKLSSILPPSSKREVQELQWPKGSLIPVAYASNTFTVDDILKKSQYASVSVAIPEDNFLNGLIMESSGNFGEPYFPESFKMAELGMKNRDRKIKEIISSSVDVAKQLYEPVFTFTKRLTSGLSSLQMNEDKNYSFSQLENKYITLFACCVLG